MGARVTGFKVVLVLNLKPAVSASLPVDFFERKPTEFSVSAEVATPSSHRARVRDVVCAT